LRCQIPAARLRDVDKLPDGRTLVHKCQSVSVVNLVAANYYTFLSAGCTDVFFTRFLVIAKKTSAGIAGSRLYAAIQTRERLGPSGAKHVE